MASTLTNRLATNKYLIYGTGNQAKVMLDEFQTNSSQTVELIGFINTSQPDDEVGDFFGYPVFSPSAAFRSEMLFNRIAIATSDFYDDIYELLVSTYQIDPSAIGYGGELLCPFAEQKKGLAIAMIVRNEARYIREWIEYHKLVGVSHLYIYDNDSDDGLREVLISYVNEGFVTYIFWPGNCVQVSAYNDALKKYGYLYRYMGFIDSDEFLVPTVGNDISEELDVIVDKYEGMMDLDRSNGHIGGIGVNWRNYGTSFHREYVEGLLLENYKYRAKNDYFKNMVIKTICIPERTLEVTGPHTVRYKDGYCCVSEKGSYISGGCFPDGSCERLRLNHYYSKSEEECISKFKRGWPDQEHIELGEEYISNRLSAINARFNDVYDDVMDRFIPLLKEELRKHETNEGV